MGQSVWRTAQCAVSSESARAMLAARKRLGRYQLYIQLGSIYNLILLNIYNYRGVAQLVARLVRDQEAMGSSPVTSTIRKA